MRNQEFIFRYLKIEFWGFFFENFDFEYLKIDFETAKPLVDGEFDAGLIYQLFINPK